MGSQPRADHAERVERLWDMVRAGEKLHDAKTIAEKIGVDRVTINTWFATKYVARIRLGARMFSHIDQVIESLRANEDLKDGLKPKKRIERAEERRVKLQEKAELKVRAQRLGLKLGSN